MPTSRRNVVGFAVVGVFLGIFFIPYSTSATPMIASEFMRSRAASAASSNPDSSHMKGMELFDYIYALVLFIFLMACYIWYTWCEAWLPSVSLAVPNAADWLDKAYRFFIEVLSLLRLNTYLQLWAEARVVGTDGTRPTSSPDGGDASPSTEATPTQPPAASQPTEATPQPPTARQPVTASPQSEVVASTHDCATASDHRHLGCVESA